MKNSRKRITLFTMAALWVGMAASMPANAQVVIDWQQSYGSLENDGAFGVAPSVAGYAVLGQTNAESSSGMFEHNCSYFIPRIATWMFGIDAEGGASLVWQHCNSYGLKQKLQCMGDDKYYITGIANDNHGLPKMRVIQTDVEGNVLWEEYFGTEDGNMIYSQNVCGIPTSDNGIVVATDIFERSGDVDQYYGGTDCWVVKVNDEGLIDWQTTIGSTGDDVVTCIQKSGDGGILLWVDSDQTGSGNIGCGEPEKKGVLVKLDDSGQILWNLCFERVSVRSIIEMDDGYLLAGDQRYTVDPGGNCGDGITTYDCFLLRCDLEGNVMWEKDYGGSCNDKIKKVFRTNIDNGFSVFANSKSTDGDVESFSNLGVTGTEAGNIWIFHVDADGKLLWELCLGSQLGLAEEIADVVTIGDKEYVIAGYNMWFDGITSGMVECSNNPLLPNSGSNIWVLKVTDIYDYDDLRETTLDNEVNIVPNPTMSLVTITGQDLKSAEVFNTLGQQVAIARSEGETMQIDLSELPIGVYFVNITDKGGRKYVRKVVKE